MVTKVNVNSLLMAVKRTIKGIRNCDSYIEYDDNPENILDASTYPSIKYDNYVGGLVGYSKMTAIENVIQNGMII